MVDAVQIAELVRGAVPRLATTLRPDVTDALVAACEKERSERGRAVLRQLVDNAALAESEATPVCQDTGTVWVRIEIGPGQCVTGDVQAAVDGAVADAYRDAGLRMSLVRDALLDRTNTGDNTPVFIELAPTSIPGVTVHLMLKGGGSDNASRVVMATPDRGIEAVRAAVMAVVLEKAPAACPPLLIGVGVGSTFDKVGSLAKRALLRTIGDPGGDERIASVESELLAAVNATGIGPAGLGGDTTALAVHIETAPCHIAAMPIAVNLGCCAVRSATFRLGAGA